MTVYRLGFAVLAIIGAIVPMRYFLSWFSENSWSLMEMVDAWHANDATSGLVWDLTIAAIALTIWVILEAVRHGQWRVLWAIPATYCIGVSCGLPLFLALRPDTTKG